MAQIRPFAGIHYSKAREIDLSKVIAPPYDVLDEKDKRALQAKHPNNIVTVDLPFTPPKSVGPDEVYEKANTTLQAWLSAGVLEKDHRPAIYPYAQSYEYAGRKFHRRGFITTVRLSPFGDGEVVPHEKTYPGPIEDRMKLMRATGMQLSPIFGLFNDPRNEINGVLYKNLGKPFLAGTLDGVQNDLWTINDADVENQIIDLMKHRPIYIADGHHRYTTALQYQRDAAQLAGGKLPPGHPANFCMFVLVSMQDPGLQILPTHRLIGGLTNFTPAAFSAVLGSNFEITESNLTADHLPEFTEGLNAHEVHTFGLFDGKSRKLYSLKLKNLDLLKPLEPAKSDAWRRLDVAILQRYLLDEVLQPKFAGGKELIKGYTADPRTIAPQVDGAHYQLALMLRPTPLQALADLGEHKEVMPQKSTYFFPKLATGMVMNPIR